MWPKRSVLCLTPNVCLSPLCLHYPTPPPLLVPQLWRDNPAAPQRGNTKCMETISQGAPWALYGLPSPNNPPTALICVPAIESAVVKEAKLFKIVQSRGAGNTRPDICAHAHEHTQTHVRCHKEVPRPFVCTEERTPVGSKTSRQIANDPLTQEMGNCPE